jgi:tape measure domain-containing protein
MASKTVQPIAIELGIKGGEKLAALNRSFRDLSKQTKLSDKDIVQATQDIVKFAKEVGNSEATIKGQIKAFEGLREQAAMGGKVYRELGVSIGNLKSALRGSSDAVERKRSSLVKLGSASKNSAKDLRYVIVQLEKLKSKVKEDSVAFLQLGKDIKNLNVSLKEVEISSGKARFAINTIISAKTEKITGQIEKLNDSIASGTLNAEDLNTALRKLELLRVGAERSPIAFRANVFSSELGVDYFARLSKEYGSLEKTQAAITQRISEVNTELTNVTGYERRRALTVELIQLNKDLQNAIVNVTTKEQFQAMAIRQRMGAARESYSQSGFGAFSASIRQRSAAGEFTPGMQRAKERARNQIVDEGAVIEADELFRSWSEAYEKIEEAAKNHKSEMLRIQTEKNKLLIEQQDNSNNALINKNAEAFDKELALFDRKLSSRDRGRQRAGAIKSMLGLGGVDLSPLYEGIVGIGSSRQKGQQARMGRTSQGALSDIINVFNSDLERTGDGFLDSEKKLRESAIEFAGGSKKVRQRFEKIALGKTPIGMFPETGESSSQYKQRLEGFSLGIKSFVDSLRKTGNGFLQSEKDLRNAAIKFSGNSSDVARAFGSVPLGKTPTSMLPGSKETPGSYVDRIRGFSDPEIPDFSSFRKGTIRELNLVKQSLEELRLDLDPLAAATKDTERKIIDSIRKVDKELERRSRTRRKFSPGKAAQVAGATISGGIFGGPEGFLGGAIGGAIGNVGGAFAGAALGAQVGQLRQTLGGFADYAASITRLKIALEGITEVQGDAIASQGNYARAVAAAANVTKELNVPQEVAINGITRLTAAVKGAGGGVADAELAFKNITAAITATGGGAEQVEGAVTALVQIFSKGKVSAEEINQIAERLPGTFNKIAEASGRTGPELTKALQSGEVGLNDLMKFLVQLGGEYGELAKKIAGSSESAGARLTVAYNNMRIEIGKALQPIGAEFQEAFLEFITDIGPALVRTAKAVGEGLRFIIQNRNAIETLASFAAKLVAVNFALKAFVAFNGPLRLMFALIRTGFRQTTQEASLAATNLAMFGKTVKALAASLAAPIVITFAIIGAELVISYFNRIKQAKADLDASGTKPQGEVFFRSIGGTAATKETLRSNFKDINKNMDLLRQRIKKSEEKLDKDREARGAVNPGAGMGRLRAWEREDLTTEIKRDKAELARNELNFRTLIDKYPYAPDAAKPLTVYADPTGTDGGGKGKGKGKGRADQTLSRLISLQNEYDSIIRSSPLLAIQRFQVANSLALVRAQEDNNAELINTIKNNEINLGFADQELQIRNQYIDAMNAANSIENPQERLLEETIAKTKQDFELEKLLISANGEKLALAQDTAIAAERIAKASEVELFNLRDQLGLVGKQERIVRFSQSRIDARDPNAEQQTDLYRQTIDPTLAEGLTQNTAKMKKELDDLVNPINQITGAANAIGGAFSQSFTDAISGSKSAKEALADFFKSVGSYFLDMAMQIIAKMVTIAILNAVTGLLPGGKAINSTSLGAIQGYSGVGANTDVSGLAVGLRANGGPVSANTPYIVGERGPELMVPSTSGMVLSNSETRQQLTQQGSAMRSTEATRQQLTQQDSAMRSTEATRQQLNTQRNTMITNSTRETERMTEMMLSNPDPIDVRYESTVINNVEYVTAEQHRQGMAQAAERGRSLTLSALQGSVKTRKKVGLS